MRNILFTSAFCKARMLEDCLKHIYKTPPKGVQHVILDNHYPIDKRKNRAEIQALADTYGCTYIDSERDLGVHHALNRAMKILGLTPEDRLLACDPDDRPSPGFCEAFCDVLQLAPTIAVLGTNFDVISMRMKEGVFQESQEIGGHKVLFHPSCEMWNVAAYNPRFIEEIGGFNEPHPYYGGIEAYMHQYWLRMGLRLAYLADIRSDAAPVDKFDPAYVDPEYRLWKDMVVCDSYPGSFEELLRDKFPQRLNSAEGAVDRAWESNR